jgi:hypothetical protein
VASAFSRRALPATHEFESVIRRLIVAFGIRAHQDSLPVADQIVHDSAAEELLAA